MIDTGPEETCGHVEPEKNLPDGYEEVTCDRPVWKYDRCIWHADLGDRPEDDKPVAELEESLEEYGTERIDGAELADVDAAGIDLPPDTELIYADLSGANLEGAELAGVSFLDSDLSGANLKTAILDGADLRRTDLTGARFRLARLLEARLEGVVSASGADFTGADLTGASLFHSDIEDVTLEEAILDGVDLSWTSLRDADLPNADLSDTDLTWAVVWDTDLSGADLTGATLDDTLVKGEVDFTEAIFPEADFSETHQEESEFEVDEFEGNPEYQEHFEAGSEFHAVDFSEAVLEEAVFANMELSDAEAEEGPVFEEADLIDADFRRTDVREANFELARLVRADFLGSDLRDARLYQAHLADAQINSETDFGDECIYEVEAELDAGEDRKSKFESAAWQYRKLEELHREQALSKQAGKFHRWKEGAKYRKYKEDRDVPRMLVQLFNKVTSSHGENPYLLILISAAFVVILGLAYPKLGIDLPSTNTTVTYANAMREAPTPMAGVIEAAKEGIYFSVVTFTTLGYGDVQPANPWSKGFAMFESFTGALLLAYLVLVLGRRIDR